MLSRGVSAALAVVLLTLPGCAGGEPGDAADPITSSTISSTGSPSDQGSAPTSAPGSTAPDSTSPASTPAGDPPDGSVGDALEMPAASPTEVALGDLLRDPRQRPLLSRPIPAAAHARGRLVAAFPGFLRPVRRSLTLSSSLSPSGVRLQVALEAVTELGTNAVLREYRRRLTRLHMREAVVAAAGGSEAMSMRRGRSSLVVTVTSEGNSTAYTIYGTLEAGQ